MESVLKNNEVKVDFNDLEIAFHGKSENDITRAFWLFKAINSNLLVRISPVIMKIALQLHLPVLGLIKATIFRQFCGGETIEDSLSTIDKLYGSQIGSVLDYSVEGADDDEHFESTCSEICNTVLRAEGDPSVPFCVFKMTGVGRFSLLEKVSSGTELNDSEEEEYSKLRSRILKICSLAYEKKVKIFIDAEESWIQKAIDNITTDMMKKFNRDGSVIVFNTIQLYRHDRLEFLRKCHQDAVDDDYRIGLKLVRGAYMEKERERARLNNYESPIHADHDATNADYDESLRYCMQHLDTIEICAGTHNEESCKLLAELMAEQDISPGDHRIWFSQLLGMSDHISFNLAYHGYNVAKYVPYGPVKSVLPYLIRRAQENTSISGQMGRELKMIIAEKKRRRSGS